VDAALADAAAGRPVGATDAAARPSPPADGHDGIAATGTDAGAAAGSVAAGVRAHG
jgi:hypothetical protein